jgi:hypothetical protein
VTIFTLFATMNETTQKVPNNGVDDQVSRDEPVVERLSSTTEQEKLEAIENNVQAGVRAIEAAASAWSTKHLIAAYVM